MPCPALGLQGNKGGSILDPMKTLPVLSSRLSSLVGVADGTYSVLNAWDNDVSSYDVTVKNGEIVAAQVFCWIAGCGRVDDISAKIDVSGIARCNYFARGFDLLHALSAVTYDPTATGNEDTLGLGLLNE
jgi:hypothetical protein